MITRTFLNVYQKGKSTARKVREITTRIQRENREVLKQRGLLGGTIFKRYYITEEQRRDVDVIVVDI